MLADTHAHLYWESFEEDFDEIIQRAKEATLGLIINVGVDIEKSQKALEMVEGKLGDIPGLETYSTIGIHPHEAIKYNSGKSTTPDVWIHNDMSRLENIYLSNPKKVVGVGECGLDYFFDNNPDHSPTNLSIEEQKELQRKLLLAQKELAKKLDLPLIIHIRDDRSKDPQNSECWNEAVELLKDHYGIFHCYSGLPETTQKILNETSFLISFAATITYPKNDYLREAAKLIPLERIVLETDCPFLPSQQNRGKRNEPSTVKEIATLIADLKEIQFEEVAIQTTENARKLFKI